MRQVRYLSKGEAELFFRAIPPHEVRDRLMFDLIYRHGLRRKEAVLLRDEFVQDDKVWIGRVKNGVSGAYPLHPTTKTLLAAYTDTRPTDSGPYLLQFRQIRGERPISTSTVYERFRRYARIANLPKEHHHVHVLRHSIAVHFLDAGWGAADVQDWLGHKNISSTMIYATITNQRRERNHERTITSQEIAQTGF
jgi:type 1 fimbriae regulatory protein FimB